MRVEINESHESIHDLTSKSLQHERKLRKIHEQSSLAEIRRVGKSDKVTF